MILTLIVATLMSAEDFAVSLEKYPTQGQPTTITTTQPIVKLTVTYQPDAPVADVDDIAVDSKSEITWTPRKAGVVRLEVYVEGNEDPAGTQKVSVKFDGIPTSGVVIALLAGIILFGGATISLRSLMSAPEEEAISS